MEVAGTHGIGCNAVVGSRISHIYKFKVAVIIFVIVCREALLFNAGCNTLCTGVAVMGRLSILGTVINTCTGGVDTVQTVGSRRIQKINGILGMTVAAVNSVPAKSKTNKINTSASYRTDLVQILIIFKDTHETGDTALNRCLIQNIGIFDTGLRTGCLNIIEHNSYRSLSADGFIHVFTGEITLGHAFRSIIINFLCTDYGWFRQNRRRFLFNSSRRYHRGFHCGLRCTVSLTAAGQCQCQDQSHCNDLFCFHCTSPLLISSSSRTWFCFCSITAASSGVIWS